MPTIRDLGLLADAVYNELPAVQSWTCPKHRVATGRLNGFQAATFTQAGVTVMAFRGTAQGMDVVADLKLGTGMNTTYFSDAEDYAAEIPPGDNVYVCGHSLGGAIAQVVANRGGYKMVTFNAPRGRPLTEELRGLLGVCTPGWVTSSSTALRVAKGSSKSWRPPMVLLTDALCVCTISAPAATSTTSLA